MKLIKFFNCIAFLDYRLFLIGGNARHWEKRLQISSQKALGLRSINLCKLVQSIIEMAGGYSDGRLGEGRVSSRGRSRWDTEVTNQDFLHLIRSEQERIVVEWVTNRRLAAIESNILDDTTTVNALISRLLKEVGFKVEFHRKKGRFKSLHVTMAVIRTLLPSNHFDELRQLFDADVMEKVDQMYMEKENNQQ